MEQESKNAPFEGENEGEKSGETVLPHATELGKEDEKPPLYMSGFGVMGQSVPDVATGSTPLTRKDD